jgi:ElaB/YqjD/DUF883 family membrane-anchored ribosome-binding protein
VTDRLRASKKGKYDIVKYQSLKAVKAYTQVAKGCYTLAARLIIFMEDVMAKARASKEKLIEDFHSVISDTEELMRSVSSESGGKAQALRTKLEQNLQHVKGYLQDFEESVVDKSKVAARVTDDYVHENAWQTVGLAIGLGVVIGLLLRNRD